MHASNRLQELFQDPSRTRKPRQAGITHVLDKGLSVAEVEGLLEVAAGYVDIVKFGWGTSVVVENLDAKIELCPATAASTSTAAAASSSWP